MTSITYRCATCGAIVALRDAVFIDDLPRCRKHAGAPAWKQPEAFRPTADEAGREALDAPQREFEPGAAEPAD